MIKNYLLVFFFLGCLVCGAYLSSAKFDLSSN